jgi:hypothetical protein
MICLRYKTVFNAGLIRLVGQTKISLLLKIQQKQHNILYLKIVYKYNITLKKVHAQRGGKMKYNLGKIY